MINREPPDAYKAVKPTKGHIHFHLRPQFAYDGFEPLYMVMRADDQGERILAERCLLHDATDIVDALRLSYSIATWGTA